MFSMEDGSWLLSYISAVKCTCFVEWEQWIEMRGLREPFVSVEGLSKAGRLSYGSFAQENIARP